MKNFVITICLIIIAITARSQAFLEHVYQNENIRGPVKLENYGWVYFTMPYGSGQDLVKIYSIDHVLLKSISLTYPNGFKYSDVSNVSDVLFNSDAKIEVLYGFYKNFPPGWGMYLINEDGSILQEFPNHPLGWIFNIDGDYKMLLIPSDTDSSTYIYDLPGTMVEITPQYSPDLFSVYPNPCSDYVNFSITNFPAEVSITSTSGMRVGFYPIHSPGESIIDLRSFAQGNYLYTVKFRSGNSSSGKLMVVRN